MNGNGTVFAVNAGGAGYRVVHAFTALDAASQVTNTDGANPDASWFCPTTFFMAPWRYGGTNGNGTVFAVNTNGSFSIMHAFTGLDPITSTNSDGANPYGALVLSGATLYGTAANGGNANYGTVFKVNTNGTGFAALYSFTDGNDGAYPDAGLVLVSNMLYGTASSGGSWGAGTVFAINTNGSGFAVLHTFSGLDDGAGPYAGLTVSGNKLYGTTSYGGSDSYGTVFAVNTGGTNFVALHEFSGGDDGAYPSGSLVLVSSTLYGATSSGGSNGNGTLFAVSVTPISTIQFTASPTNGPSPLTVQFNSTNVDSQGNAIAKWNWSFGDGANSTLQNPSHTYATVGNYTPTLIATNNIGVAVPGIAPAITVANPTIQFTAAPTNGTPQLAVQFNSPGTDSLGNNIVSWNWSFGDGATSTLQNPSHIYTTVGNYTPVLVATNINGNAVPGFGPTIATSIQGQNLFAADTGSGNIYKFTPDGMQSTFATGLTIPDGLAFDGTGRLICNGFRTQQYQQWLHNQITPGGLQSTFATGLSFPPGLCTLGLAVNSAGDLFVADSTAPILNSHRAEC